MRDRPSNMGTRLYDLSRILTEINAQIDDTQVIANVTVSTLDPASRVVTQYIVAASMPTRVIRRILTPEAMPALLEAFDATIDATPPDDTSSLDEP